MTTKQKSQLVLAHWDSSDYFPFAARGNDDCEGVWLNFRHSDETDPARTRYDERSINLGLYIWLSQEKRCHVVFRGHNLHSLSGDELIAQGRYVNALNKKAGTHESLFVEVPTAEALLRRVVGVLNDAGVDRCAINNEIYPRVGINLEFLQKTIHRLWERVV